jgi:aminopeptidase N
MRKIHLLALALLFAVSACGPAAPPVQGAEGIGDPYYPGLGNGGYDVQNYSIILSIDPETNEVNGSVTIEAKATESLSAFDLDFSGLTIDSITVNSAAAGYARAGDELTITPASPLGAEKKFTTVVSYHGNPGTIRAVTQVGLQGVGWGRAENGAINVLNEPNGASSWFPSNNHPRDKATYRFEISVPKPWVVAATGTLEQTTEEGDQTKYVWVMDEPMASYLASINVDQYVLRNLEGPHGIRIRSYFPSDYPASDFSNFDKLPEMLAYLESQYGPYPFKEYGVVVANPGNPLCQAGGSAVETQTLSVHCPSSSMAGEEVIVHELAHQWFGDSVSLENWKDVWLKEGLATYSEWLWLARDKDREVLDRVVKAQRSGYYPAVPTGEPPANSIYRDEVYRGGGLVIHALRIKVGDEAFFKILRTYLDRYKYGNAGTQEFINVAEQISGQDLKSFFDAWLFTKDLPAFE